MFCPCRCSSCCLAHIAQGKLIIVPLPLQASLFTEIKAGTCAPACMHGAGVECIQIRPPPFPPIVSSPPAAPFHMLPFTSSGQASYAPPSPRSPPAFYTPSVFGSTPSAGVLGGYGPPPGYVRGYGYIGSSHTSGGGYTTVYNVGGYSGSLTPEANSGQSVQGAPPPPASNGANADLSL